MERRTYNSKYIRMSEIEALNEKRRVKAEAMKRWYKVVGGSYTKKYNEGYCESCDVNVANIYQHNNTKKHILNSSKNVEYIPKGPSFGSCDYCGKSYANIYQHNNTMKHIRNVEEYETSQLSY